MVTDRRVALTRICRTSAEVCIFREVVALGGDRFLNLASGDLRNEIA
jgi:hypothetical protein